MGQIRYEYDHPPTRMSTPKSEVEDKSLIILTHFSFIFRITWTVDIYMNELVVPNISFGRALPLNVPII